MSRNDDRSNSMNPNNCGYYGNNPNNSSYDQGDDDDDDGAFANPSSSAPPDPRFITELFVFRLGPPSKDEPKRIEAKKTYPSRLAWRT